MAFVFVFPEKSWEVIYLFFLSLFNNLTYFIFLKNKYALNALNALNSCGVDNVCVFISSRTLYGFNFSFSIGQKQKKMNFLYEVFLNMVFVFVFILSMNEKVWKKVMLL